MGRLEGRVAWITGGASGIGRGIALEFAREGCWVVILDKDAYRAGEVADEIVDSGGAAIPVTIDLAENERLASVTDGLLAEFGRVDILVNNAAVAAERASLLDSTLEDWRRVQAVNLDAVYILSKLAAKPMAEAGYGRIVNIASVQAFMASGGKGSYNAAKAGVVGLTRSMAIDLAPFGIAVNAIAPGFVQTPMSKDHTGEDETESAWFKRDYLGSGRIPMGRSGQPEDIAGTALWLASEECTYFIGQTVIVDGGLSLVI